MAKPNNKPTASAAPVPPPKPTMSAPEVAAAAVPLPGKTPAPATAAPASASAVTTPKQEARTVPAGGPTSEQIARRAYEIYQARGGQHGRQQDDWFQAERELKLGKQ